jgi:hypothetical protein
MRTRERTGSESQPIMQDLGDNSYRRGPRRKRNILGDLIHVVTGLATDDELQNQLKLDKDLRDRLAATMERQIVYERDMASSLSAVMAEEETLEKQLSEIKAVHRRDRDRATRLLVGRHMIQEDIDKMEDVLEAVWSGTVSARHSTYLSSRSGLGHVGAFKAVNCSASSSGVLVYYMSRLYRTSAVVTVENSPDSSYMTLATPDRFYYLHPGHTLRSPITEQDVRGTRTTCSDCAVLYFLTATWLQCLAT